jgi:hypothetical protein
MVSRLRYDYASSWVGIEITTSVVMDTDYILKTQLTYDHDKDNSFIYTNVLMINGLRWVITYQTLKQWESVSFKAVNWMIVLTLLEYLSSSSVFCGILVTQSLVFCVLLCRPLLSFCPFFAWSLHRSSICELRHPITIGLFKTFHTAAQKLFFFKAFKTKLYLRVWINVHNTDNVINKSYTYRPTRHYHWISRELNINRWNWHRLRNHVSEFGTNSKGKWLINDWLSMNWFNM